MKEPHTPLPWHLMTRGFNKFNVPTIYATGGDLEYVARLDKDPYLLNSVQDNVKNAEYIVQAANMFPEAVRLLEQITEDLAELQNNTNDLALDALYLFYDRMCANVTDVEQFLTKLEEGEK